MSLIPAQTHARVHYSAAVDVYSLGVVLWEIATQSRPYQNHQFDHQVHANINTLIILTLSLSLTHTHTHIHTYARTLSIWNGGS